jgi:hypothetical protein
MTYNQIVTEIRTILESHAMLNSVRFATPTEWINWEGVPELPIALYAINTGTFVGGYQKTYTLELWLLDKSGKEGEFETEVTSDMHGVLADIVNALNLASRKYSIDLPITWTAISDDYEDYLSGVTATINIYTNGQFTYCDFPTKP